MSFIHAREYLDEGDVVVVDCDHQCNVLLTTDSNFQRYRSGQGFQHYGGYYTMLPARITAPSTGFWNITIDLGGGHANIKYSVSILKNS